MFPPPPLQSPTYSHYSAFTPTTSPIATSYFPPQSPSSTYPVQYQTLPQQSYPPQPQQSYPSQPINHFPLQHTSPFTHLPHTPSNLATLPVMSGSSVDGTPGPSGLPAKRAIDEQDRKSSIDDGNGSGKKKRVSLSCAQCESGSDILQLRVDWH